MQYKKPSAVGATPMQRVRVIAGTAVAPPPRLDLPPALLRAAEVAADEMGVSIEDFILRAVAEKIGRCASAIAVYFDELNQHA